MTPKGKLRDLAGCNSASFEGEVLLSMQDAWRGDGAHPPRTLTWRDLHTHTRMHTALDPPTHIHTHQGMHTRGHSPGQASAAQLLVGPSARVCECVCLCVCVRSWADVLLPMKCLLCQVRVCLGGSRKKRRARNPPVLCLRQEGGKSDCAVSEQQGPATVAWSRVHPRSPEEPGKKPCQG